MPTSTQDSREPLALRKAAQLTPRAGQVSPGGCPGSQAEPGMVWRSSMFGLDCSVHRNSVAPDQALKPHRSQDWELVREQNPALLPVGSNTPPHSTASTLPSTQPSFPSSCPLAPLTHQDKASQETRAPGWPGTGPEIHRKLLQKKRAPTTFSMQNSHQQRHSVF